MNIVVKTYSGHYIVRPDTTWERDNEDFYPPEFVSVLSFTPVLFARICKPGRSIGLKFASRYYDGINFGMLLYPEEFIDGAEEGFACASCLDHTSFLPFPIYNKLTLGQEGNRFELMSDGKEIFSFECGTVELIEKAIAMASERIYLRSGDILTVELDQRKELCRRTDGDIGIVARYCHNESMQFRIKF